MELLRGPRGAYLDISSVNLFIQSFAYQHLLAPTSNRWHHAGFWGYKDKVVFKEFIVQCREKQKDDLQWVRAVGQENSLGL